LAQRGGMEPGVRDHLTGRRRSRKVRLGPRLGRGEECKAGGVRKKWQERWGKYKQRP